MPLSPDSSLRAMMWFVNLLRYFSGAGCLVKSSSSPALLGGCHPQLAVRDVWKGLCWGGALRPPAWALHSGEFEGAGVRLCLLPVPLWSCLLVELSSDWLITYQETVERPGKLHAGYGWGNQLHVVLLLKQTTGRSACRRGTSTAVCLFSLVWPELLMWLGQCYRQPPALAKAGVIPRGLQEVPLKPGGREQCLRKCKKLMGVKASLPAIRKLCK